MNATTTRTLCVWRMAIALVLALACGPLAAAGISGADSGNYTAKDKEYYLTADEIFFIRPGLVIEIVDVTIPDDLRPVVTFTVKDPGGLPLDVDGVFTPGPVDMRYTITYIPQGEEQKVRYTSGTSERNSNGTFTALGDGMYSYKFAVVLPDTWDPDATHAVGVGARRDLRDYDLGRYADNSVYNFVPSGASEPQPRDVVRVETCNGRCHDPLAMHGSRYVEIAMCTQCHNPQLVDDGVSYSFNVLIHRVHEELEEGYPAPLNDCQTCHTGGTPTEAFPLVATPNPVPVCDFSGFGETMLTWGDIGAFDIRMGSASGSLFASAQGPGSAATGKWVGDGTEFFLVDKASGATVQRLKLNTTVFGCAGDPAIDVAPGTFRGVPAVDHTNWLDHPAALVCGACHTDVNFDTGENHIGGPQADDTRCGICHRPSSGNEFDASIAGAHTVLYKSSQLPGVLVDIVDVKNTAPGQKPQVQFRLGSKNAEINPADLDRLRFSISGPNEDFSYYVIETVGSSAIRVGDLWVYNFQAALPLSARGSYTLGFEGRNEVEIDVGEDEPVEEEDQAQLYTFAFAVTDAVAVPRRVVVEDYNCEGCHTNLSLHGGNRNNPQYCVTCHRPDANDSARRPADQLPPESIHFKYLIHRLHRGEDLENPPFIVYGFGNSLHDFSHVEFPGDLRNCAKCHAYDERLDVQTYELPLPQGVLATVLPRGLWTPVEPIAAACLACHDSDAAASHAYANTSIFGESCVTCHGDGTSFAVEKVHAR